MLKAYSVFKDFDKKACEILKDFGIQLSLSTSEERPSKEELIKLLNKYDILIVGVKERLTKDLIEHIHSRKIISTVSIGVDHIDKQFFNSKLIKIINCQTSNVISVSEHIFALILGLKKRIIEANNISISGGNKTNLSMMSNDLKDNTIGVIGAGKISREVIKLAKAFDMKILCNTLNPQKNKDLLQYGVNFVKLDQLLSASDIITINIPLNKENKNLISKEKINLMKKTATFINTSRAEIVDIKELIKYADIHSSFNVGLDIDVENYKDILKKKRNNVIVTPHIAGITQESVKRMDIEISNEIVRYLKEIKHIDIM